MKNIKELKAELIKENKEMLKKTFPKNLKFFRENYMEDMNGQMGLSQKELSAKTKIPEVMISQYERGVRFPKEDKIRILAEYLDVSPARLIGLDETIDENFSKVMNYNMDFICEKWAYLVRNQKVMMEKMQLYTQQLYEKMQEVENSKLAMTIGEKFLGVEFSDEELDQIIKSIQKIIKKREKNG